MISCEAQIECVQLKLMTTGGGLDEMFALSSSLLQPLRGLSAPVFYIISYFVFPFSKTAPLLSPLISRLPRRRQVHFHPSASFASWLHLAAQVFFGIQVANWFPSVGRKRLLRHFWQFVSGVFPYLYIFLPPPHSVLQRLYVRLWDI